MPRIILISALALLLNTSLALAAGTPEDTRKQTTLGLYLTSAEAMAMWRADDRIRILDVRTPEEYAFIGHAPMAVNIPLMFMAHDYDTVTKTYAMRPNPDFISQVKARYSTTDTILVMCRSGQRSGPAVDKMAEVGFTKVYNIVDGFEGDPITDKNSPDFGRRIKDGWRISKLPWTYTMDYDLMFLRKK